MTKKTFDPLHQELDLWSEAGLTLPLWWRDDDATQPSDALNQLRQLSRETGIPVHLAIIPQPALPELGAYLANTPEIIPVQHGWTHQSHSPESEKKAEFGRHRTIEEMMDDIRKGRDCLKDLLPRPTAPIFVPPWNRMTPDLFASIVGLGFSAVSTYGPRGEAMAAPGLARINTHIDPIDWRGTRDLVPPEILIARIVQQLADRRNGRADNAEPYGLLTHHLVHTDRLWDWVRDLMTCLAHGPVQPWRMPNDGRVPL
ncbi:MAG: polysaccharide deacetylase family protein [Pseudomonadota bacterium]